MNMTTTEKNWLQQFTTKAKAAMTDALRLRKRDYEGYEPPDVAELRKMNKKIHEHDRKLAKWGEAFSRGLGGIIKAMKE